MYYTNKLDDLGQYYTLYYKLMQHWRKLDAISIFELSYEDLVNDQENQTRRLLDACGLEWNDACLEVWQAGYDRKRHPGQGENVQ